MENQTTTEPHTATAATAPIPTSSKGGVASKKLLAATILLSVGLLGAAGYIIFDTIRDNNREDAIYSERPQVSQDEGEDAMEQPAQGEVSVPDKGPAATKPSTEVSKISGGPYIEGAYLYVPSWGLKYRLDDSLTDYGISYVQKSESLSYTPSVGLAAVQKADLITDPQTAYYDTIESCAIASIGQTTPEVIANLGGPREKYEYGGKGYVIYDYSARGECSYNLNIEAVAAKLTNILLHPEKI